MPKARPRAVRQYSVAFKLGEWQAIACMRAAFTSIDSLAHDI